MDDYIKRADAINSTWKALYAYEDRTEEQFQNDPDLDLGDWALHRIFVQGVHAEGLKEIIGIPAADVVPVIRGRWIGEPNCWYRCSECGEHYPSLRGYMSYNYCPSCGAAMSQEAEE